MMKKNKISLYIHIPFCESRCHYCDFCSSVINEKEVQKYTSYLKKEISLYQELLRASEIESIFFGGGTPSSIDEKYISEIMEEIYKFKVFKNPEISLEGNPNSLTYEKLKIYKSLGINRISMGAQSFNEKILKSIGRVHKTKEILEASENIKSLGFKNFNLDLMLALPYQKLEDLEISMAYIKKINPSHISYYSLIIEDGTNIKKLYEKNRRIFPNEDEDRQMYHYVCEKLCQMAYDQYEISNFAKKGFESRHNLSYWKLKNYLGFGLSASSNIGKKRFTNTSFFTDYYQKLDHNKFPISFSEELSKKERISEFAIMGIRLNKGIDLKEFSNRFSIDFKNYYKDEIKKHKDDGLLWVSDDFIGLSKRGRDLSNIVEVDFIK
ncbi:radical SAM family heme chaperone HemW [Peptoniphilus raoultii]|uniref:radical SAM family heme chaperone HemW n=1 Tax=Peptoniphilus raoultii TaxID=1776387 RepID=UPI0008D8DB6B|nr:radical SAM family heme chaperone HemW [Peptoniphilus raoultii]